MKKTLLLLALILVAVTQADILTDWGVDSGFEARSLDTDSDGIHQMSDGFGHWFNASVDPALFDIGTEYNGERAGVTAHSGNGYGFLAGGGDGVMVLNAPAIPCLLNTAYTLGVWVKGEATLEVIIGFDFFDPSWNWFQELTTRTITSDWAYHEFTASSGPDTVTFNPKIAPSNELSQDSIIYTDDWTLIPEPMTLSLLALGGLLIRKRK